jgi:hypothetical protein
VPAAKKKAAKPAHVAAEAAAVSTETKTVKKPSAVASAKKPKLSGKPFAADATPIVAGREAQGLKVTKQLQMAAETNAKQNRLKASGLIRIQKNRSAANKRNQGRRDSR